ncbi:MAG: aminodeoxychorismate/anthranilate synthase component II [Rhodospirillales bacterium]|nr:aminodeoxychorismate/anthranilate synthase component II [Rhodospirillales bacterium]
MIILIDNYDSFTYNLVQYLGDLDVETEVHRNDQISVEEVLAQKPAGLMISPGPSDPDHAGICLDLVKAAAKHEIPLIGVCLGHQTIGQAFGGKIVKTTPLHGKMSNIVHEGESVFAGLPHRLKSRAITLWSSNRESLPDCLEITARTENGIIMGVAHKTLPIHGVQFHPESIATQHGHAMLKNFCNQLKH